MGGRWTLRDIVDYELIATMALLDTVADRRETLLRQIYAVNRETIEAGRKGDPAAILVPIDSQHDPHEALHLADKLQMAGVEISRAEAAFEADGKTYPAGTLVIPMAQVFARYAKDMLEKQTYPEVRRAPNAPPEPPYDVTAWSLGMLLGVDHVVVRQPLADSTRLVKLSGVPALEGRVTGSGSRYAFDYRGADDAIAINLLLKDGARVAIEPAAVEGRTARVWVTNVQRKQADAIASARGLQIKAADGAPPAGAVQVHAPRIGMYQPWAGGNMDEGWTRWTLEQYQFTSTPLHNADVRAGKLREKYDAIIVPDQSPRAIIEGASGTDDPSGVSRRDRRRRCGGAARVRGAGRHADHARRGVGPRDREVRRAGEEPQGRPDARSALCAGNDPQGRGRSHAPDRLRHAAGNVRLLQQQPVLQPARRVLVAEDDDRGALSEHRRRRVRMAQRRRADGRPRGGGIRGDGAGPDRPVRAAAAASRPDTRDVPAALQRALSVGDGRAITCAAATPQPAWSCVA